MNIINFELLLFDYLVVIFSLIIILFSFWKGFVNSILGLLTWVGSVFITIYSYELISDYFYNLLISIEFLSSFAEFVSILSLLISIPLIFLISLFIFKRIRRILSSDLDKQILGLILDKFFGVIYGIIFTYVIYSSIIYLTQDNSFNIINNINFFLIENSNILKHIAEYNENIIEIYNGNNEIIN